MKLKERINSLQEQFDKATDAEKRVMIAKEVIEQAESGFLRPRTGDWVSLGFKYGLGYNDSVKDICLSGGVNDCECCALGSLLISCTLYNNNINYYDFLKISDSLGYMILREYVISNGLNRIFSKEQLMLIECAYEGVSGFFALKSPLLKLGHPVFDFYKRFEGDPTERLIAIMQNIIDNKGEFIP